MLSRAARIHHTRLWITNTTTILIGADTIRKIVVIGAELIRAIIAHPGTSCTRCYAKRHTVICHTDISAWHNRGTGYSKNGQESEEKTTHCYSLVAQGIFKWVL